MNCLPLGLSLGDGVHGEHSGGSPGIISGKREQTHHHHQKAKLPKSCLRRVALCSFTFLPQVAKREVPRTLQMQEKQKGDSSPVSEKAYVQGHR